MKWSLFSLCCLKVKWGTTVGSSSIVQIMLSSHPCRSRDKGVTLHVVIVGEGTWFLWAAFGVSPIDFFPPCFKRILNKRASGSPWAFSSVFPRFVCWDGAPEVKPWWQGLCPWCWLTIKTTQGHSYVKCALQTECSLTALCQSQANFRTLERPIFPSLKLQENPSMSNVAILLYCSRNKSPDHCMF